MTTSTSIPGSKVGRARRRLGQLWQVPTFLIGLLAFLAVAASAPWRLTPQEREFTELLTTLRRGLEQDTPGDVLVGYAQNAELRMEPFRARSAEAHFLIGSAYDRQAKQTPAVNSQEIWPRASEHLESALALGGADADQPALRYRLGFSLYQQNKDVPHALELMTLGVEKGAEQPLQGYQLLVEAHLKRSPPNLDAALSASARILDLTPERETEAAALARLQHAELLIRKELRPDALKELERIGTKASPALRIKARLLQARCCEEDGLWSKAIPIWQELLGDAAQVEGGPARISYALGWCYHHLEPPNHAETTRAWSEALKKGGPAGQAAGLRLGELRLSLGDKQSAQALVDWKDALEKVNGPKDFRNPYVDIAEVREWFKQAIRYFHEAQDPQKTQAVAELYRKIAAGGGADDFIGEAAEALAQQLADKFKAKIDNVNPADVQAQFRRAAEAYEQAAKARPSPESLYRSAQCYLAAKEPALAQKILHQYVQVETNEALLAEGWHTLGDLYRAQGQKEVARKAYLKCLEYPNTAFAYRSRYFLAVEEIDKKNYEKARDILMQNLEGSSPDIDRAWQEKSLYKMASLLMKMKDYGKAHTLLKECLGLYPENPNVLLAREQLGECYRRLAANERVKEDDLQILLKPGLSPERRFSVEESVRQQRQTRMATLTAAVTTYQKLGDEIVALARSRPLTVLEQTLLRRAWLGIGECQLDNEEYDGALSTFEKLQVEHRRTLEGFYASLFICHVADRLQAQPLPKQKVDAVRDSAKKSVRLLFDEATALPVDHEIFRTPGVPPREWWLRQAESEQRKLMTPPRSDSGPAIR
jgi:tetratricopeptide (TPR) repeat protein